MIGISLLLVCGYLMPELFANPTEKDNTNLQRSFILRGMGMKSGTNIIGSIGFC
jgi:hypothetical protein